MDKYLTEIISGEPLYKAKNYFVQVAKMPDMPTSTYAIINSNTGLMEQLHPTFFGARRLADMFSQAEDGEEQAMSELDGVEVLN